MGYDIHIHQEVKIHGKWEHYRTTTMPRDYQVFAKMAGVLGRERPIAEPRGLPDDLTVLTKFASDYAGRNGHTHTWLNAEEILTLAEWLDERAVEGFVMGEWNELFGNDWIGFAKYPTDRPDGLEDVRFVFWFDH